MEEDLQTERKLSTKQGNADHWQHKGNTSDGKDTLHQERKPCTVGRW
jgi:hypothetical protein